MRLSRKFDKRYLYEKVKDTKPVSFSVGRLRQLLKTKNVTE
jgi:hypothetical protein